MYAYIMRRTQISLTPYQRRLLDKEAARTGRSVSALIRDAVIETYSGQDQEESSLEKLLAAAGSWERDVDGAQYVEQLRSGKRLDEVRRK